MRYYLFAIILGQVLLLVLLCQKMSINCTEVGHLGAGCYFYETGQFDLFHVNGLLTRYLMGVSIRLTSPEYNWKLYSPRPHDRAEWLIGAAIINANSPDIVRWAIFRARCFLISLVLLGSWFGWRLASEIYCKSAGILFLIFWTFSPLILGWGTTICPDVSAASLGIIAIYFLRKWLLAPKWCNVIWVGVTLGLLPLAKLTWIIGLVIWFVIWGLVLLYHKYFYKNEQLKNPCVENRKERIQAQCLRGSTKLSIKQFVIIILIAFYVINMGYGFEGSFKLLKDYRFNSKILSANPIPENISTPKAGNRFEGNLLGYLPVPFPAEFVQGIDTQKLDFERGMESYLRGEYAKNGWWYYYLYLLTVREPLGIWILLFIAIGATCTCRLRFINFIDELVLLVPAMVLLTFISLQTGFSLHPRYIILVLPFMYLWISKLGFVFEQRPIIPKVVIAGLLGWIMVSSLLWFPHSMSYFNELIRSPWHGRFFTKENPPPILGSNIDWGQNLYFLKNWYDKNLDKTTIFIDYTYCQLPDQLGIKSALPPQVRQVGYYAIGINELFSSDGKYKDFQSKIPVHLIGYSIYIYHITQEDIDRVKDSFVSTHKNATIKHDEAAP